ncbi:hypothetical protein TNCV_4333551 [Trichonephila clavipes]|nr:hypothetical protein TNCV_4333551 [Trichonephila clavipes]
MTLPAYICNLSSSGKELHAVQRICTLQWIPAHVDIFGNKQTDDLAKEALNSPQHPNSLTLTDADEIA